MIIDDGAGTGYKAEVDTNNRLHTHSLNIGTSTNAAMNGDLFATSTGVLTLTTDGESGIFYIKNTNSDDFLIIEQFLVLGASTGGSGPTNITYYTNPTAGTLISDKTAITASNRRLASSITLSADVYSGGEGKTVSGGVVSGFVTAGFFNTTPFVIPQGVELGISITPPTGNSNMDVTFGINLLAEATKYVGDD
jgi:hypothetical protein